MKKKQKPLSEIVGSERETGQLPSYIKKRLYEAAKCVVSDSLKFCNAKLALVRYPCVWTLPWQNQGLAYTFLIC